jgi:ADP-ribose pyrophosphatase YjhB (NUDIX family)
MSNNTCNVITGAALILKKDNKILLFKRNIPGKIAYGSFALPGGTVETHETIKHAACREASEEIGVTIDEKDLSIVHLLRLREKYDQVTHHTQLILMLYFMEVSTWAGEPKNMEPHKHSELGWFDVDNLPHNTYELNFRALQDIQKGNFHSEYGWL